MKTGRSGRIIKPAFIEIDGCDPEVARIVADVFNEMLSTDEEFLDRVDEIHKKVLLQDYEDEHYNSPECNQ